jgi:DNA-binding CsgD family transcriptional regulator
MSTLSILHDPMIDFKTIPDYGEFDRRIKAVYSFAMVTQTVDLVIDHYKKCTWLYHYNPGCIDIFGGLGRRQVADNYFDTLVSPDDADLFSRIGEAIKECTRNDFLKGDKYYYFSFNIRLGSVGSETRMFSLKVVPFLFTATDDPWVTVYYMEPSAELNGRELMLHAVRQEIYYHFDEEKRQFSQRSEVCNLSDVETMILKFSAEGFTEKEIADLLGMPVSSLKNCKMKMFMRLSVSSISAAISLAWKKGLLE